MTAAARRCAAACLLALLFPPAGAAALRLFEPAAAWEDPAGARAAPADLAFPDPGGGFFRNRVFFLLGRLDDGSVLTVVVFSWRQWFLGGWGAYAAFVEPDGRTRLWEERLAEDGLRLSGEGLSLSFRGGLFEAEGGRCLVRLSLSGFSCDLSLDGILPPWKPGDGRAVLSPSGDASMRFGVAVPWGVLSGSLEADGRARTVRGQGYADTSLSVLPLDRQNPEQFSFRAFSGPGTAAAASFFLSLLQYRSHEGYGSAEIRQLLLAGGGTWILTSRDGACAPAGFTTEPGLPAPYPTSFPLRAAAAGCILEGRFECSPPYLVTDILKDIPPFLRDLVSVFLKRPVIFRFLGVFRGTLTRPDGSVALLELHGAAEYQVLR